MMVAMLLDRATEALRAGKDVVLLAADHREREVLRAGLRRRVTPGELERAQLCSRVEDIRGRFFDELLVTDRAIHASSGDDLELIEHAVKNPRPRYRENSTGVRS